MSPESESRASPTCDVDEPAVRMPERDQRRSQERVTRRRSRLRAIDDSARAPPRRSSLRTRTAAEAPEGQPARLSSVKASSQSRMARLRASPAGSGPSCSLSVGGSAPAPRSCTLAVAMTSPCSTHHITRPAGQWDNTGPNGTLSTSISRPSRSSPPDASGIPPGEGMSMCISMPMWAWPLMSMPSCPLSSGTGTGTDIGTAIGIAPACGWDSGGWPWAALLPFRSRLRASSTCHAVSINRSAALSSAALTESAVMMSARARGPGSWLQVRSRTDSNSRPGTPHTTSTSASAGERAGIHPRRAISASTRIRQSAQPGTSMTIACARRIPARLDLPLKPTSGHPHAMPRPHPARGAPGS